jgi:hypothetical protein
MTEIKPPTRRLLILVASVTARHRKPIFGLIFLIGELVLFS